eukprot:12922791-Prorocentrum_lima.AAC.1
MSSIVIFIGAVLVVRAVVLRGLLAFVGVAFSVGRLSLVCWYVSASSVHCSLVVSMFLCWACCHICFAFVQA